jgi:hypothetical protein
LSTWRAFPIAVVALFYLGYLTGCADSVSGAPRDQSGIRTDLPSRTILVDDRDISMTSPADAPAKREELVQFLWGTRGFGGVQHIFWRGGPGWSTERLGSPDFGSPVFRGFPSAVANDNGSLDVYVRSTTDELWEASQTEDGAPWNFVSVATLAGAPNVRIDGSPSAIAARSQGLFVAIRSSRSKGLVIFERPSASHLAAWSVRSVTLPNGSQTERRLTFRAVAYRRTWWCVYPRRQR